MLRWPSPRGDSGVAETEVSGTTVHGEGQAFSVSFHQIIYINFHKYETPCLALVVKKKKRKYHMEISII